MFTNDQCYAETLSRRLQANLLLYRIIRQLRDLIAAGKSIPDRNSWICPLAPMQCDSLYTSPPGSIINLLHRFLRRLRIVLWRLETQEL